ncbi:hypothetical protein [Thermoproteus uzoniensis]|uniref:hypothetical protein n=1 Tax=Thermoproteus uzoniensis TaxID=184117 RepID=UPI0011E4E5BC|nr:hypothetical protein [Thermoproteus uzoniensis]
MKSALAVVLFSFALLLAYLYLGGLLLGYLRVRPLPYVNVGDFMAVALILLYGYAVYFVGQIVAKRQCEREGRGDPGSYIDRPRRASLRQDKEDRGRS